MNLFFEHCRRLGLDEAAERARLARRRELDAQRELPLSVYGEEPERANVMDIVREALAAELPAAAVEAMKNARGETDGKAQQNGR